MIFINYFLVVGLTHFDELLGKKSLQPNILILEKNYNDAILKGELDERMFVNDEDSLIGSGSLSGGIINMCGTKVCCVIVSCFNLLAYLLFFFLLTLVEKV